MPLNLIHGPPNSGARPDLSDSASPAALDRDPILVVPDLDDVFDFERELCERGRDPRRTVMTFGGLFATVAATAGAPPGAELTPAQRLGAVTAAVAAERGRLGPLGSSAGRPGFARALAGLLDELQGAGLEPAGVEATATTLEGSAYLSDMATLFAAYAALRDGLDRIDSHGIAREAIAPAAASRPSPGARARSSSTASTT